jgi:hypothetical protein
MGASTSWNPLGLFRPVMGLLYLHISLDDIQRYFKKQPYYSQKK